MASERKNLINNKGQEMYAVFESENKKVNIGTLGHVDFYQHSLCKMISNGKTGSNKSDRKRDRKNRWR